MRSRTALAVLLGAAALLARPTRAGDGPLYPMPAAVVPWSFAELESLEANGDGLPDLLVAGTLPGQLAVLVSADHLSWNPTTFLDVGVNMPVLRATGDFDGDGDDDVVAAAGFVLSLVAGDGVGGFAAGSLGSLPASTAGGAAADVDADGDLDLVIARTLTGTYVAQNQGTGAFAFGPVVPGTWVTPLVRTGDLEADGVIDYVVGSTAADIIASVHGLGGGAFAPGTAFTAMSLDDFTLANLNGDAWLDIVWVGLAMPSAASARLGAPGGSFGPTVAVVGGSWTELQDVAAGDLDGDGDDDIVLTHLGYAMVWVAHTTAGVPTVGPADSHPMPMGMADARVLDANGDGRLDVALAMEGYFVTVLHGSAAGLEVPAESSKPYLAYAEAVAGDFTLDGVNDLVLTSITAAYVMPGLGDGAFGESINTAVQSGAGPLLPRACADFDGDGLQDVAITFQSAELITPKGVRILFGQGDGKLLPGPKVGTPVVASGLAAADFDLDGLLDLAGTEPTTLRLLLGNGAGGFSVSNLGGGGQPVSPAAADVDEDGLADLVNVDLATDSVHVRLNAGGVLGPPLALPVVEPRNLMLGDLDGDGRTDMAVGRARLDAASTDISLLRSVPGGWSTLAELSLGSGTGGESLILGLRDATGDGQVDVQAADVSRGLVGVAPNDGAGSVLAMRRFYVHEGEPIGFDANADGLQDFTIMRETMGSGPASDTLRTSLAAPVGPWFSLGHALAGSGVAPQLRGTGELIAGQLAALDLDHALPAAPAALIASVDALMLPWKSGMLVPALDVIAPVVTSAQGALHLELVWPAGVPAGLDVFFHLWVQDAGGPSGFAASNALRAVTP